MKVLVGGSGYHTPRAHARVRVNTTRSFADGRCHQQKTFQVKKYLPSADDRLPIKHKARTKSARKISNFIFDDKRFCDGLVLMMSHGLFRRHKEQQQTFFFFLSHTGTERICFFIYRDSQKYPELYHY